MKIIDLTIPLYNGIPAGHGHRAFEGHPLWPEAFKMEETLSYEPGGMRFHVFTIFCEPGTRFILPSFMKQYEDDPTLDTVDLNKLIHRDAVILDVPKGADEIIEAEELEAAFNRAPWQKGDALLVRTGWGDNERYLEMGSDFSDKGPHFNGPSAEKLMELLEKAESDLWLYDNCDMGGEDKKTGEFGGFTIRAGLMAVGGIVDAGEIKKERVKLIILPLKIKDAHMTPCRIVAIEE